MLKMIGAELATVAPLLRRTIFLPELPPTKVMEEPVPPLIAFDLIINCPPVNELRFRLTLFPKVSVEEVRVWPVPLAVVNVEPLVLILNAP